MLYIVFCLLFSYLLMLSKIFFEDSIGCDTSVRLAEYAHNMLALRGNATQTKLA
jgi:hypothetical protein